MQRSERGAGQHRQRAEPVPAHAEPTQVPAKLKPEQIVPDSPSKSYDAFLDEITKKPIETFPVSTSLLPGNPSAVPSAVSVVPAPSPVVQGSAPASIFNALGRKGDGGDSKPQNVTAQSATILSKVGKVWLTLRLLTMPMNC